MIEKLGKDQGAGTYDFHPIFELTGHNGIGSLCTMDHPLAHGVAHPFNSHGVQGLHGRTPQNDGRWRKEINQIGDADGQIVQAVIHDGKGYGVVITGRKDQGF